jgi:hypothetical protein
MAKPKTKMSRIIETYLRIRSVLIALLSFQCLNNIPAITGKIIIKKTLITVSINGRVMRAL